MIARRLALSFDTSLVAIAVSSYDPHTVLGDSYCKKDQQKAILNFVRYPVQAKTEIHKVGAGLICIQNI